MEQLAITFLSAMAGFGILYAVYRVAIVAHTHIEYWTLRSELGRKLEK